MLISSKIYNGINGEIKIPGDKSISHRSIIIPSISNGVSEISNILKSEDVLNTINAFKNMGVKIDELKDKIIIYGKGLNSLNKPSKDELITTALTFSFVPVVSITSIFASGIPFAINSFTDSGSIYLSILRL